MTKCLIIPVHSRKANWLYFLLDSMALHGGDWRDWDFDIVLAVSNHVDQFYISRMISEVPFVDKIGLLCIDDYIQGMLQAPVLHKRYIDNTDNCIINLKKMVALHWAQAAGYAWAACIDSDAVVCADLGPWFSEMAKNYQSGYYISSVFPFEKVRQESRDMVEHINRDCIRPFSSEDAETVMAVTRGQLLHSFFADVPFYAAEDLKNFFNDMAETNGTLENYFCKLTWFSFEHIVFSYWRYARHSATPIIANDLGIDKMADSLSLGEIGKIKQRYGYCPSWVRMFYKVGEPEYMPGLPGIRLLFHTDRFRS